MAKLCLKKEEEEEEKTAEGVQRKSVMTARTCQRRGVCYPDSQVTGETFENMSPVASPAPLQKAGQNGFSWPLITNKYYN